MIQGWSSFPVYMVKLSIYICDKLFGCFLLNSFFKSRNGIYEEVESEGLGERFPWGIEEHIWNWNGTEVNVSVEAMWQEYLEFGAVEDLLSPSYPCVSRKGIQRREEVHCQSTHSGWGQRFFPFNRHMENQLLQWQLVKCKMYNWMIKSGSSDYGKQCGDSFQN